MTDVSFKSTFDVDLIRHCADDLGVLQAARVSTKGKNEPTEDAPGLIDYLMKNRHGSPFEHNSMTFYVHAPIFVWREFMRHRIASYNEESARYSQMKPVFYLPPSHRPLVQVGTSAHPRLVTGGKAQWTEFTVALERHCTAAYAEYERALSNGIAREAARNFLPVDIYSSAYVTMNARALMNFLSLRVKSADSTYPSNPQWEINVVASYMEEMWAELMPLTWRSFVANGRVCP